MVARGLLLHPGALGDVLLALPALAHLGQTMPDLRRVVATTGALTALLAGSPYAEETVPLDRLALHRLFVPDPDARALEPLAAFDVIVSWFGAGDATYRANLDRLTGRRARAVVVARAAPRPGAGRHASRYLVETLAPLQPVPAALPAVRLPVAAAEAEWAVTWLREHGLAAGEAIVLHPGAGNAAKVWPAYAALARALHESGVPVVIMTGPADPDAGVPAARLARDLPLPRLAALVAAARAFVGNDSGPSHLAAAVGCRTVALFGPTDPAVWAPGGPPGSCPHVRVLQGAADPADPWRGLGVEVVLSALPLSRVQAA
jgi:heptosyltransferase III